MTDLIYIFQGGRKVDSVTSVTLVNNVTKTIDTTVPTGKRWFLIQVKTSNVDNVARVLTVRVYKEAGKTNILRILGSKSSLQNERMQYPSSITGDAKVTWFPAVVILDEGNTITAEYTAGGASAGGTDADGLVIEYLEMSM